MSNDKKDINKQNKKLYAEIKKDLKKNIDADPLIKILPSYSRYAMYENNKDDLYLNLILNNSMNLRIQRKDDDCNFLVPIFVPFPLNEKRFCELIYYLYHLTKEQADQLAEIFVNEFGSNNELLFDYFVNAGFPNIFQNFISINHCEAASSIINSLISISQKNDKAIRLTIHLLTKFVLSCFPFIQEFRNNFTSETLFKGLNDINNDIKDPFNQSFNRSILFLSVHHVSSLKLFFESLPGHQDELVNQLTNGILSNINNMDQFIIKSFTLSPDDVRENVVSQINDLQTKESLSSFGCKYPNIDESLFYNQKKKISLTHSDVYILSIINQKISQESIYSEPNFRISKFTMNTAFAILSKDYQIEFDPEKETKPLIKLDKVDQSSVNKWEGYKESSSAKCVDPVSLLDFTKEDATECLEVFQKEIKANKKMQTELRERMSSITYVKQVKDLIIQMNSELLRKFAQIDFPRIPATTQKLFKKKPTKWKIFSDYFLRASLAEYSLDSKRNIQPIDQSITNEIESSDLYIESYGSLADFVESFTRIQSKLLSQLMIKNSESKKRIQQNQKDIKESRNGYIITFSWLQDLLRYESLFSFDSIKIEAKDEKDLKFNLKQDTEMIDPYYKLQNLLRAINSEINDQASKHKSSLFSRAPCFTSESIACFIILFNEIYKDVNEWDYTYNQEHYKNHSNNDKEEEEEIFDDDEELYFADIGDIIFSTGVSFPKIYRVLNDIIKSSSSNQLHPDLLDSLKKISQILDDRKI